MKINFKNKICYFQVIEELYSKEDLEIFNRLININIFIIYYFYFFIFLSYLLYKMMIVLLIIFIKSQFL